MAWRKILFRILKLKLGRIWKWSLTFVHLSSALFNGWVLDVEIPFGVVRMVRIFRQFSSGAVPGFPRLWDQNLRLEELEPGGNHSSQLIDGWEKHFCLIFFVVVLHFLKSSLSQVLISVLSVVETFVLVEDETDPGRVEPIRVLQSRRGVQLVLGTLHLLKIF